MNFTISVIPNDIIILYTRLVTERIGHTDKNWLARQQLSATNIVLLDIFAVAMLVDCWVILAETNIVILWSERAIENSILHRQ